VNILVVGLLVSLLVPLAVVLFVSWMILLIQLAFVTFDKLEAWGERHSKRDS